MSQDCGQEQINPGSASSKMGPMRKVTLCQSSVFHWGLTAGSVRPCQHPLMSWLVVQGVEELLCVSLTVKHHLLGLELLHLLCLLSCFSALHAEHGLGQ